MRRTCAAMPSLALLFCTVALLLSTSVTAHMRNIRRDAYSDLRRPTGEGQGPTLTTVGERPAGAKPTTIAVGSKAEVFAWYSRTPRDESEATHAYIILHGIKRNAESYFATLNSVWADANEAGFASAGRDTTIRVAPLFMSTARDAEALNATTLGWGDPSEWVGGDASTHPLGSNLSVFTVLDTLLKRFADRKAYPAMKRVTFVAHGAGGQTLQRYAVLGRASPSSRVAVRYVIGDPSSMLHFTRDRPEPVDTTTCSVFDDFRYGFSHYKSPYTLASTPEALFKRYLSRDVRYVIGRNDTREDKGDQLCAGVAMGGSARKDRSLNYWAYLHLLRGQGSVPTYPGLYTALDPAKAKKQASVAATNGTRPVSTAAELKKFKTSVKLAHQIFLVPGAGHSAKETLRSDQGRFAIFAA
ncbi:unnamed protein product [Parajaminaea phylloscopi]